MLLQAVSCADGCARGPGILHAKLADDAVGVGTLSEGESAGLPVPQNFHAKESFCLPQVLPLESLQELMLNLLNCIQAVGSYQQVIHVHQNEQQVSSRAECKKARVCILTSAEPLLLQCCC